MLIRIKKKNIVFAFNLADHLIEERKQSGHQSAKSISFCCDSFVSHAVNYTPLHLPPLCITETYRVQKHQISYLYLYSLRIIFLKDCITVFAC